MLHRFRCVVEHIEASYDVPFDFEVSSEFGVHSDSCYEERLVAAWTHNQLELLPGKRRIKICHECASIGHMRDACPDLVKSAWK